jgi:hypothetical protein
VSRPRDWVALKSSGAGPSAALSVREGHGPIGRGVRDGASEGVEITGGGGACPEGHANHAKFEYGLGFRPLAIFAIALP